MAGVPGKWCQARAQCWLLFYKVGHSAPVEVRITVVRRSLFFFAFITSISVSMVASYMGHLCEHTGGQERKLTDNQCLVMLTTSVFYLFYTVDVLWGNVYVGLK